MRKGTAIIILIGVVLAGLLITGVSAQGPVTTSPPPVLVEGGTLGYGSTDTQINYQGHLYDATGTPLPGSHQLCFTLCTNGSSQANCAATQVWQEAQTVTADTYGRFNALLGSTTALDASHFRYDSAFPNADRYLMVEVGGCGGTWLSPNQLITSVAMAVGNIRKNTPDTTSANVNSPSYLLTVNNTGSGNGLQGVGNSGSGYGLRGDGRYGVYGYSSTGGWGVYGTGSSGVWGVEGRSPDSYGVYGVSNGNSYGVYGYSSGATGIGVRGYNAANIGVYGGTSTGQGVRGYASGATTYGVIGHAESGSYYTPSGRSAGVNGSTSTAGDIGVFGINSVTSADVYGVVGVAGTSYYLPPTGASAGAVGSVATFEDYGVFGINSYAGDGYGVVGVAGTSTVQTPATGSVGVVARGYDYGIWASAEDIWGWAGYFNGDVMADYYYQFKNVGGEARVVSMIGSPESWIEDFGSGTLVDGEAVISIEVLFAETVNLEADYHVFLTPLGDCQGLYVANKTPTLFKVRELGGGKSNIAFDYRIVAKQLGHETMRMPILGERAEIRQLPAVTGQTTQMEDVSLDKGQK